MKKIIEVVLLTAVILFPLACGKNLSPTANTAATATPTPYPDWNITSPVTVNAGSYNYGNVHIYNTGSLQLMGPSGAMTGAAVTLNLSGNFVMDSGASVIGNGTGYGSGQGPGAGGVYFANAGGGGHGGFGGVGGSASAGVTNDDSAGPTVMGSGGGGANGGYGGALLMVTATGASLYGSIQVNGNSAANDGGGAGGTIYIKANTIFGNGSLQAGGGGAITPNTGGGGGGMVCFSVHSGYYFTGSVIDSGASGSGTGSTGAIGYFTQTGY
jgi:hypothetical protein